jgi:putative SOS response-associated peptidase YedK
LLTVRTTPMLDSPPMCGRFTYSRSRDETRAHFGAEVDAPLLHLLGRYNIAPTQTVLAVGQKKEGNRKAAALRWGLIPSWAKELSAGTKTFNARAETLLERPTFRDAFRQRRCLVLADGFYEWDAQRQPVYFYLESGRPFAFAGLWDSWKSPAGETVNSCTVITTTPNQLLRSVHDRMPVILSSEAYDLWLDRGATDVRELRDLLSPFPAALMKSRPVGRGVGDVRKEGAECAAPLNMGLPGVN